LKSDISLGTSKLRHFFQNTKGKSSLFAAERCKTVGTNWKHGLNPNHCSIAVEKVFFLPKFLLENKRLTELFSLLETRLNPFES
jgi:hypothetical protein